MGISRGVKIGLGVFLLGLLATGEASAQMDPALMEKLKGLAGQYAGQGGIAQMRASARMAYEKEEQDWAACKALPNLKARAACYEREHDRMTALISTYLQ